MAERQDNSMKNLKFVFPIVKPTIQFAGREEEIDELTELLYKKRMRSCSIIGNAGVGKTELVREVARRNAGKFAFFSVDMGLISAGTQLRGSFEDKIAALVNNVRIYENNNRRSVILFIDEVHTICTVGGCRGYETELTAANMLKPYISNGDITVWGATTENEYIHSLGKDFALARRMPPIFVKDLPVKDTVTAVNNFCEETPLQGYGELIVRYSDSIKGSLPDKAIELADRVQAKMSRLGIRKPKAFEVETAVSAMTNQIIKEKDKIGKHEQTDLHNSE